MQLFRPARLQLITCIPLCCIRTIDCSCLVCLPHACGNLSVLLLLSRMLQLRIPKTIHRAKEEGKPKGSICSYFFLPCSFKICIPPDDIHANATTELAGVTQMWDSRI